MEEDGAAEGTGDAGLRFLALGAALDEGDDVGLSGFDDGRTALANLKLALSVNGGRRGKLGSG